ncbi:MAG: USH1C-binding protein 1 [Desulfovibrio sp.]|nr:USH1C-binding protein 1 [Desulfovibrio sp.]
MSQVNATANTQSVFSTFSAHGSPQMALAMLQMELAKTNKEQAMAGIKEIENEQAKKKEIADALNQARDYKASDKNYTKQAGGEPYTSKEFNKVVEGLGLTVPDKAGDKKANDLNWDKLIAQLQTKMDTVGANIQTQMVQLQDFMGQYNSYMQGANSAIATANQVLTSLAKGQ